MNNLNVAIKEHLLKALEKGVRKDGRALDEFREITIERGVSATAHGSARVTAGGAEIIAGVKIDLGTPYPDSPNQGSLMISTELLPLSHKNFEPGPPKIGSIEAARVIDRTIRESKTIDLEKLCIEPGEKNWNVMVDLMPVNFDGNMISLGAIAAMAALQDAKFPVLDKEGKVNLEELSKNKVELNNLPVAVTVFKIGDQLLVDPTEEEEKWYDARLTIATLDDGKLCALQKGGETPLKMEEIEAMVALAQKRGKDIRKVLKK